MNRRPGRFQSHFNVSDAVPKFDSSLSTIWQQQMPEAPSRCWDGLDKIKTFAKYIFASVHRFWDRRYQDHQHMRTQKIRTIEEKGQRSVLWRTGITQVVTWVKKGSSECSICGDMVVGMSVNCIARQEYRGKADLDFTRLAYLRQ